MEDEEKNHHKSHTSQSSQTSYFCQGGDTPKVQIPYETRPGEIPRKLAIERYRREYLKVDFEQLLAGKRIASDLLMPKHLNNSDEHGTTPDDPVSAYLPLEMFDNEEYDCRTPEDWLALGNAEGSPGQKPVPAKALLPADDETPSDDPQSPPLRYSWHVVGVLDYSKEKCQYLVQKVHQNTRQADESKNPNKKHRKGISLLVAGSKYWVPRIRLLFRAEDPLVFVERIQFALRYREHTEALIFYHLSVECMPIWPGAPSLSADSLEHMKRLVLSAPGLRLKNLENCIEDLEKEIKLEYDHTMNSMIFEKVVMSHPEEFPHITLPQRDSECVPQTGCVPVPHFDYKKRRDAFVFTSMLTKPEVICVLSKMWSECNKVVTMTLFNVTSVTPLQLDEFVDIQSKIHTKTNSLLRTTWTDTLRNNISSKLATTGKGAYNINESHWEIYKMSKLYKLMTVVRLNQQDSLRHLVLDSLASLTQLLLDACHSVLTCPQDLVWGSDLLTSPYKPKKNPLFLLDLVLDQTGVHYSTSLGMFETSIVTLFDKGIQATYSVPQLDKFVMKNLFIGDDPLLESVKLWEPEVTELREKVRNALIQAAIPLRAYAAEYEKHLELHNLDVETLLKSHNFEQTSQELKKEVEQHFKEKERIELSLPSSIVIGPFVVHVEGVRLSLSQKRKALANALLDRFVLKLRNQIDNACEECHIISRKLHEKPNSIEELTEMREWMKQIPELLKSFKEHIDKILPDYELFEELRYCLTNEEFNKKWTAIGWPQRIINQIETATLRHVEDEENFCKIHLADQNNLEEQLDSLQMYVAGLASHSDTDRAHETANKVRHISEKLIKCQTTAQKYNTRSHLLGLPVRNYDRLEKLMKDLQLFKDLWITTSDWLQWTESWFKDPLSSIDPQQLECSVTDALESIHRCIEQFKDIPDCQMAAAVIHSKIEDFRSYIPLIQSLRNPVMRSHHWKMLSERIQIKVHPKSSLTLSCCLELGLQNHMDDIVHVADVAAKEYSSEQMKSRAFAAERRG
ncbi:dynein axonemal heavy chain 1-like isoform X2 [Acanthochromis polyacanthus]|uniref:dynein axonemal heavy chain 1-like isoform X2 n=1 Tax=Acanthochromis polyacanthus TaxID=80966 RepID=UPI002234372D|nr:dynein axonemal heavy chain 1-like isoform X2 [Acanthochromis polyacanthus]